jgi:hypothetical protein
MSSICDGETEVGRTPIVVLFPGVRGRQRRVAAVPVKEMVAEVRRDQHLSREQAAKLVSGQATFGS